MDTPPAMCQEESVPTVSSREQGYIDVGDGRVWYESAGAGDRTLLLLHGGPGGDGHCPRLGHFALEPAHLAAQLVALLARQAQRVFAVRRIAQVLEPQLLQLRQAFCRGIVDLGQCHSPALDAEQFNDFQMLAGLRHWAVVGCNDEQGEVDAWAKVSAMRLQTVQTG